MESLSAQMAAATVQDRQNARYSAGFVSCFWFQGTNLVMTEDDCGQVKKLFGELFGDNSGSVWGVPRNPPRSTIEGWIADRMEEDLATATLAERGSRLLYVVYFGCHGAVDPVLGFTLSRGLTSFSQIRDSLLRLTRDASCDILFLLDACHSEAAYRGPLRRNVEVIAAAEKDQLAPAVGFTPALIATMHELAKGGPFSTKKLHEKLVGSYDATPCHGFIQGTPEAPIVFRRMDPITSPENSGTSS